jgi:GH24 family phage-related lysozyme (muramidase)
LSAGRLLDLGQINDQGQGAGTVATGRAEGGGDRKKAITGVKLTQAQFDALVSLAYNLGNIPEDVADAVNAGNFEEAGTLMQKYIHGSDGFGIHGAG